MPNMGLLPATRRRLVDTASVLADRGEHRGARVAPDVLGASPNAPTACMRPEHFALIRDGEGGQRGNDTRPMKGVTTMLRMMILDTG